MIELRASVAKRDHQTGLRLSCAALARPDEGAGAGATRTNVNDDDDDGSVGVVVNAGERAVNDEKIPTTNENERFLSTLVERGGELVVVGFWESRDAFDPLPALHLLSSASGGTPAFKAVPSEACEAKEREEIESLHFEMCAENKSAVVQVVGEDGRASELHLVAVPSGAEADEEEAQGEGTTGRRTRFVAFKTEQMAPVYAAPLLVHNRLVVVFDLDETLVQATTLHLLDRRIEQARAKLMSLMKFDFSNPRLSEVMKDEMKKDRASTEQSLRRLQIDRSMLFQYVTEAAITVNGRRSVTIPEIEQLPDGQQRLRNVIRVPSPHIKGSMCVFTMINPADPSTAVLMHVRPGWEELKNYLAGSDRNRSKRAEVFVCTMALKDYAREVCRILDPFNIVFDPMQLDGRLKNVKAEELKSISKTCGSHFPRELTVIVDDRTAVWEAEAQPHILAVTPFMPYGDVGAPMGQNESGGSGGTLGTVQSMLETLRLRWHMDYEKFAVKARAHVHQTADHGVVRPPKDATEARNDGASTRENADDEADANKEDDALKRAHNRKKSERLFYPPDAGELLKPLMDLEAKEAAVGIASAGGAARAAGGSGSRLAAALGALDRHQTVKMQNAKLKAQAEAEAKEDSDAEEEAHEEKEHQPKFRHIDMSTIEEETAAQEARAAKVAKQEAERAEAERVLSMKTPASKKVAKTSPTKKSPTTLSGKKRSRGYSSDTDSDEDEPESESEPEPESESEADDEEEVDDYGDDAEDDDEDEDEDEDEEDAFDDNEEEVDEEEEAPPPPKVKPKPKAKAKPKPKAKSTPPKPKPKAKSSTPPKPKPKAKAKTTTAAKKKLAAKKKEKVFREGTRASRRLSQSH